MIPVLSGKDWNTIEKELPQFRRIKALQQVTIALFFLAFISVIVGHSAGEGPLYMFDRERIFRGARITIIECFLYPLSFASFAAIMISLKSRRNMKFVFRELHDYLKQGERLVLEGRGIRISSSKAGIGITDVSEETLFHRKGHYSSFAGIAFGALFLFYGAMSMGGMRSFQTLSKAGQLGLIITGGVILAIGLGMIAKYAHRRSSASHRTVLPFKPLVELLDPVNFKRSIFPPAHIVEYFHSENFKVCIFTDEEWKFIYRKMENESDANYQEMMNSLKNNISFDWKEAIQTAYKARKLHLMAGVFEKSADDPFLIEAINALMQSPMDAEEELLESEGPLTAEQSLPGELKKMCKVLRIPYKEMIKTTLYTSSDIEEPEALRQVFQAVLLDYILP